MKNYRAFFEAVQKWQQEIGNKCTVCWGSNMHTECAACGFWGKCVPKEFEERAKAVPPPKLADF